VCNVSAPQEEIARAVARRLEGEVGPKLPMYVDKLIALGNDAGEAAPQRSPEAAMVIALAAFAVNAAKTAWDVYWKLVERKEKRGDADQARALSPGEVRLVREQLAREIRESARLPEVVPTKLRIAAVENLADATMEEAQRLEAKP
jgi:hypothetical protein